MAAKNAFVARFWSVSAILTAAGLLASCSPVEEKPAPAKRGSPAVSRAAPAPAVEPKPVAEPDKAAPKPTEPSKPAPEPPKPAVEQPYVAPEPPPPPPLGEPLVDNAKKLIRLQKDTPVFIDKENKQVVIQGRIAQRASPLEMLACLKDTKEHEAVVVVETPAFLVHTALLAVGAQTGTPVRFHPDFSPATGQEIDIEVRWKEGDKLNKCKAQEWIRNTATKKAMAEKFVFAGSGFWTDPTSGERHYQAEGGDLICVSNFSSATIDVNIHSSASNDELGFEAFTEHIPARATPVTLILKPVPGAAPKKERPKAEEKPADKKADTGQAKPKS